MPFSAAEQAALGGLNVDPTQEVAMQETVDVGDVGRQQGGDQAQGLDAYKVEYGAKVVDAAYARGWRPKEEHNGNPENWVDPVEFFDRYAETSDKRANRAAEARMQALEKTVEKRLGSLNKKIERIDDADRQTTDAHYTQLIANAAGDPAKVQQLMKQRDEALASIDAVPDEGGTGDVNEPPADVKAAAQDFMDAHPYIMAPVTRADQEDAEWVQKHVTNIERQNPGLTPEQVFQKASTDLKIRRGESEASDAGDDGGRRILDGGGTTLSAQPPAKNGALTTADLNADEKSAMKMLIDQGIFEDEAAYCASLAETKAEEAALYG